MHLVSVCLAALAGWTSSVHAQQFFAGKQSYDVMGLSDGCTKVLDTELENCHTLLFARTDRSTTTVNQVLTREELDLVCEPKCREELSTLRQKIVEACSSSGDIIRHSGFELPAFYFADKFAYTYDLNCYRHKSSGRYCDEVFSEWRNGEVEFDQCDDCYLGPLIVQISSPVGVSDPIIAIFKETMAACPNAHYDFEVATSSKVRIPTPPPRKDTRKCARWYTVKKGDTCVDISLSQNSSTIDIIHNNAMNINCTPQPVEGDKLCLPEACNTHMIRPGETCASIAAQHGISKGQFKAMNDMIDQICSNIARWESYVACISPTGLMPEHVQKRLDAMTEKRTRPKNERKPLAPGSSEKCILFVNGRAWMDADLVEMRMEFPAMENEPMPGSNKCSLVADYNGVASTEFRRLNPSLDPYKCILKADYSYCLAEEGGMQPQPEPGWDPRWGLRWG
ncbi:hypothetical protein F5X68DRAFT_274304 [Plectosphaerella plurivora]|uniref:LysM domain-containing protein n=1 Tax=Plectosphaerella plurivora TaxID=936078 RepID=A0A9P8VEB8_9PEZI|nr:hypothetical protein F5X68DRAFT_274304 [Plectosphaerella plurivora]